MNFIREWVNEKECQGYAVKFSAGKRYGHIFGKSVSGICSHGNIIWVESAITQ